MRGPESQGKCPLQTFSIPPLLLLRRRPTEHPEHAPEHPERGETNPIESLAMLLTLCVGFAAALIARSESFKWVIGTFEGQVQAKDYAIAVVMALVFPVARFVLDHTAFAAAAKILVVPREKAKLLKAKEKKSLASSPDAKTGFVVVAKKKKGEAAASSTRTLTEEDLALIAVRVDKFKESFWKAAVYFFFTAYGVYFMGSKPWFYDRSQFWHGFYKEDPSCAGDWKSDLPQWDHSCPHLCTTEKWPSCSTCKFSFDVKFYYMCELGYYLQGIVSLLVWETRRKDFGVMMAHHVVTVILITFSHWARLLRIGTMVFLAHDVSDVPLELAKASRYANIDGLTNVFFAIFFLVWIMSRIVYFPAVSSTLSLIRMPESQGRARGLLFDSR